MSSSLSEATATDPDRFDIIKEVEEDWVQFYTTHWGKPEALRKAVENDRVWSIPNTEVTGLYFEDTSTFFIREQYEELYSYLDGRKQTDGVVVSGSPGIGKSFFNVYCLARRLNEQGTTLFRNCRGSYYLFNKHGVFLLENGFSISRRHLKGFDNQNRLWLLYDEVYGTSPPPEMFMNQPIFIVHASSPDSNRYKWASNMPRASIWYMDVWRFPELRDALKLYKITLTPEKYWQTGPVFRDYIADPNNPRFSLEQAVAEFNFGKLGHLLTCLVAADGDKSPGKVAHTLFVLRSSPNDHHAYFVDFKSQKVIKALNSQWEKVRIDEARTFVAGFQGVSIAAVLRGWLFEQYAILCLAGKPSDQGLDPKAQFLGFWEMETKKPLKQDAGANGVESEDVEMKDVCGEMEGAGLVGEGKGQEGKVRARTYFTKGPSEEKLPCFAREVLQYDNEREICVDGRLYVPRSSTNPLFDAFFFETRKPTHVMVWVFQVTISCEKGPGSASGYNRLKQIQEIASMKVGNEGTVEFRYVLLSPDLNKPEDIVYRFPLNTKGGKRILGNVYVQILAVSPHLKGLEWDPCMDLHLGLPFDS
ncbi:hypothetical protein K435DRAFT_849070 [Dendrothele bispora CBS 962.96]|uniref:Uncharacterized protein n=1 Tax=Dendrothele bispora (strain CBS 962.96) TaxID=1314807 RepID=A0A4S8MU82_DENBC|nr:hypothetical protein K435DRAFT_849070 [Dendrothele bispora CBS 962.96]